MKMAMLERFRLDPAGHYATLLMFALPALALTSPFGLMLVQLLVLFAYACLGHSGMLTVYLAQRRAVTLVAGGFVAYFVVSLVRLLVVPQGLHTLDGPFRLLLAISCIGFVGALRPRMRYFWLGLCIGTIGAAALALHDVFVLGMERAQAYTHHAITFGDLALALGLMALCGVSEFRKSRLAFLPIFALLCGMLASVLSGSRGGWIALILVAPALLIFGGAVHGRRIVNAMLVALLLGVLAYFIPATGIAHRVAEASSDVRLYFAHNDATTSVGIRLELWKASWLMISDHPWLGVGRDSFAQALHALVQQGRLQESPALLYSSSHNDMLFFGATGGLLDFSCLMLMYFGPLGFFISVLKSRDDTRRAAALCGVTLVLCYIGFGLTDVMFWLMIPKAFYGMMVCALAGFCLPRGAAPRAL